MVNLIDDMQLSYLAKYTLKELGFHNDAELYNQDYYSLKESFPHEQNLAAVMIELVALGIIKLPEEEKYIYDIKMTTKLFNILKRKNILFLSELTEYPIEKILQFRNLGSKTMKELICVCDKYGIYLRSLNPIREAFKEYKFPDYLMEYFFYSSITSIECLYHKTAMDLYSICNHNYRHTMKLYCLIKENGITLDNWNGCFIFEVLMPRQANSMKNYFGIETIEQLCNYSADDISMIPNITRGAIKKLRNSLSKHRLSFKEGK